MAEDLPAKDLLPSARGPRPGHPAGMDFNGTSLRQLSRLECLRLVGQVPLGRIVYTRRALPAVELVDFTLDDGDIVIRISPEIVNGRRVTARGRLAGNGHASSI